MTTFNRFKNLRNTRAVRDVEDNWILKSTLWILFLGLLTGLITIAIINIKPYTLLLASVSTQTAWVFGIPLIGPLLEHLSVDEIAAVTDLPSGTVKSRLHYARLALRTRIEEITNG